MDTVPRSGMAAFALALLVMPGVVHGQGAADRGAGIRGTVVDAATGVPLDGATVSVEPMPAGVLARGPGGVAGFLTTSRRVVTSEDGEYALEGLSRGTYRLRVTRLGYRGVSLAIHYDGPADPRVSVGLVVEPIRLERIEVVAAPPGPATAPRPADLPVAEDRRVVLERLRQARYLTPDARVVTDEDVVEAATFGETDLLRALHRLPGVTTEDDWSAEPWTRGAPWDETRVYFDGLPLLDPLHLGGISTSVSPDAVGSMTFHPGVRPADVGEAAAAVVDLRSRSATGEEHLSALTQVSVMNGRFSVDRPLGAGSGVTLSGRRSFIDEVTRGLDPASRFPYRFWDLAGRWDQTVTERLRLELSGIKTEDRLLGDLPEAIKGARGGWGNTAGRVTLEATLRGLRTRLTRGTATFESEVDVVPFDADRVDLVDATTAAATDNRVHTAVTELTVAPLTQGGAPVPWQVGVRRTRTRVAYEGPATWPYPDAANAGSLRHRSDVARDAVWAQARRRILPGIDVSAGLRLESPAAAGRPVGWSVSPRLAVAWVPRPELRVSVAAGRHHQYEQALGAAGFTMGSALVPGHLWVSAGGGIPAIRSDVVTAGTELWLPGGWLVSANAYARETSGRLRPPPDSGYVRAEPPVVQTGVGAGWERTTSSAVGLELGGRKLAGRWTGSAFYTLSRAWIPAAGWHGAVSGERTHVLDAAFAFRATPKTTVGGALTLASGAAYRRFYAFRCTEINWYCPSANESPPIIGWADSVDTRRAPSYTSLDLQLQRSGHLLGLPFGFYAQLRNVLNRDNRGVYLGSILHCDESGNDCTLADNFESGFPLLPLVGFWLRL